MLVMVGDGDGRVENASRHLWYDVISRMGLVSGSSAVSFHWVLSVGLVGLVFFPSLG